MPTIHVEANLSVDDLVGVVSRLSEPELERLSSEVNLVRAKRKSPCLPEHESELLQTINQSVPAEMQSRYDELIAMREAETLTQALHQELLDLTQQVESHNLGRVKALTELAALRQTTLKKLLRDLQIQLSPDA
jgi:hypothetical protein